MCYNILQELILINITTTTIATTTAATATTNRFKKRTKKSNLDSCTPINLAAT